MRFGTGLRTGVRKSSQAATPQGDGVTFNGEAITFDGAPVTFNGG